MWTTDAFSGVRVAQSGNCRDLVQFGIVLSQIDSEFGYSGLLSHLAHAGCTITLYYIEIYLINLGTLLCLSIEATAWLASHCQ